MTTDKPRYASVPIEPGLFDALGLDPATAGVREIRDCLEGLLQIERAARPLGIDQSIQIAAALHRYAAALADGRRRLARVFDRQEWNLMADIMNGCLDLHDYAETPFSIGTLIMANIQDGHRLNGIGRDWFGDDQADQRVEALVRKVVKLQPIEADAIGVAIRQFWADPDVDPTTDEWWLPKPVARARRSS
ncbi:MAG: hypothetical protein KGR26_06880 [Cyanobacteria bacterium REEB65]|nr:hypothetical protein [Cyanobacteria bacterium REEB65]